MPAWAAILLMIASGILAALSHKSNLNAGRAGKATLLPGGSVTREQHPRFFGALLSVRQFRTIFLVGVWLISALFLFEALLAPN